MIPVTKPFHPPLDELNVHLQDIWKSGILTNNGPKVQQLEIELKEYLEVPDLLFLTNGTIALQLAIKALELKGEIITTPFSYVATTSSIIWEGCTPIFVDIDKETFNIDPTLIEKKIRVFDFSGVDKKNNIGVYNFKKGAGAFEYIKIGEYAYSKNLFLKFTFILFIFLKRLYIK